MESPTSRRASAVYAVLALTTVLAGCPPLDYVPVEAAAALPSCHPGLVGVRSQSLSMYTRGEVTDLILEQGWVSADALVVVELDEPPSLTNPRALAEAIPGAYPQSLRERGIGGAPTLALLVDRTGGVREVAVLESSGHPELDAAGEDLYRQARYTPAVYRGCRPLYWAPVQATFTP